MKKFFMTLCVMLLAFTAASAQDIIVLKNSQRIDAKIISVTAEEISYKKADYTDGPTFTLKVTEIATIIYANGETQVFNTAPETAALPARQQNTASYSTDAGQKSSGAKLKFNPEPVGQNRPFGFSIGYTSKQLKDVDGKYPWVYLGDDESKKSSASLRLGFYWAPEFRYGVGIQTGLYYELSTSKYQEEDFKMSESEHTLSIPLRVQYRYEIIKDLSVFLYTGPSFDISLAYTGKASYMGEEEKYDMYGEDSDIKRFNMLWGVGSGVRWKGLQLMLGGDWGMTNIYKGGDKITLSKPFHISLTYLF